MNFQLFPIDILNKITEYLDYHSCFVYFRLSRRFQSLNTNKFWKQKLRKDFNKNCRKSFYDKQLYNYIASRYNFLNNNYITEIEIIKNKEQDKLRNFLITYLKKTYPNIFKVIYTNSLIHEGFHSCVHKSYKNGQEYNLIINTYESSIQAGFFINNKQIHFRNIEHYYDNINIIFIFPSSFRKFMADLGLKIADSWKLYDIPDNIKYPDGERFSYTPGQRATISSILPEKDMPFFNEILLFHNPGQGITSSICVKEIMATDEFIFNIEELDIKNIYYETEDMSPLEEN
jgi:hypothetical protein